MSAAEIAQSLTDDEKSAMLSLAHGKLGWRDAVKVDVHWMIHIALQRKNLISNFPRSGDNSYPMTNLGKDVRDVLQAAT